MTIVVDLGCQDYGAQDSLTALIHEYQPSVVYGFDPSDLLDEKKKKIEGVKVVLKRQAAWLYDGNVAGDGRTTTFAIGGDNDQTVPCIDFSAWLSRLNKHVVLKVDIEGAEYELLERLLDTGADQYVDELLIEWHSGDAARDQALAERFDCPIRQWWM